MAEELPGFEDVRAAQRRLAGHIVSTPVLQSAQLNRQAGAEVFVKCENLQHGGAFKYRGAMNRLLLLSEAEQRRGVVAYSSGNHGLAVALAARTLGLTAAVVMPDDAPRFKLDAVRAAGATVHLYNRAQGGREAIAAGLAARENRVMVPPFDDPHIIAGAGTAALELLETVPDLEALVVPVGGGGLIAGSALAVHGRDPRVALYGVEPASAADAKLSLDRGAISRIEPAANSAQPATIADGLRTSQLGALNFAIMRSHVAGIATVVDAQLIEAIELMLFQLKTLAEPSGVAAVAAVMQGQFPHFRAPFRRVGVIVGGGNLDPTALAAFLSAPAEAAEPLLAGA